MLPVNLSVDSITFTTRACFTFSKGLCSIVYLRSSHHTRLIVVHRLAAMFIKSVKEVCPDNSWWSAFFELLQLTCNVVGLISSMLFLLTVLVHRDLRQNLSLLLAANLSIGGLFFSTSMIAQNIYMLLGCASDHLCAFRGYTILTGAIYIYQSALLQILQRLFLTVFVHRHRLQNKWLFCGLGLIQFSLCFLVLLPILLSNKFVYHPASKICFMAVNDAFAVMYPAGTFYLIPLTCQSFCSYWILRHLSRESQATGDSINAARRIRKERRVLARLALPVILLLGVGVIYMSYAIASAVTNSVWQLPPYGFHLSFLGSISAISSSMVANIFMQKSVKEKIVFVFLQRLSMPRNRSIHPAVAQYPKHTLATVEQ